MAMVAFSPNDNWKEETWKSALEWADKAARLSECRKLKRICGSLSTEMGYTPTSGDFYRNPYWVQMAPSDGGELPTWKQIERAGEEVARLKGWVETALTLPVPGGRTLASYWKLDSARFAGSDYQHIPPYHTSPVKIQERVWGAYRRALPIARAYGIGKQRLQEGIERFFWGVFHWNPRGRFPLAVGKLAIRFVWAAMPDFVREFRSPTNHRGTVEALIEVRGLGQYYKLPTEKRELVRAWFSYLHCSGDRISLTESISWALSARRDEINWWRLKNPCWEKFSIKAFPAVDGTGNWGKSVGYVITAPGRDDYHTDGPSVSYAVSCAIEAWRQQAR